jgi:hypothetical protein
MIKAEILGCDDKIEPDDLVRNVYPMSYYTQATDDVGESTFRWEYAKFRLSGWIGKTMREYRAGEVVLEMVIIRVPNSITQEQLSEMGIPICMPSFSVRAFHAKAYGKLGNREHYPEFMKMPLGKYKGMSIEEIKGYDPNYLKWILDNVKLSKKLERSIVEWLK